MSALTDAEEQAYQQARREASERIRARFDELLRADFETDRARPPSERWSPESTRAKRGRS